MFILPEIIRYFFNRCTKGIVNFALKDKNVTKNDKKHIDSLVSTIHLKLEDKVSNVCLWIYLMIILFKFLK